MDDAAKIRGLQTEVEILKRQIKDKKIVVKICQDELKREIESNQVWQRQLEAIRDQISDLFMRMEK